MKHLAQDVGDLKKVLSNVKTRGILGELQLKNILEEVMAPGQYEENVETVRGSNKRVEFAIRLPGKEGGAVYLPIDSKFPLNYYETYLHAAQEGDTQEAAECGKLLENAIPAICERYFHQICQSAGDNGFWRNVFADGRTVCGNRAAQ